MTRTQQQKRAPKAEEPEAPEPEHDPEQGEEPEPAPAPEPAPEPDSAEAQARKIDNAQRKYRRDLEGIVGDLGDAAICELCGGLGFTDPHGSPRVHPDTIMCDKCAGLGQLVTGSRTPGHEQIGCDKCGGVGHVRKEVVQPLVSAEATVVQMPLPAQQVHGWMDPATGTFHAYGEGVRS